MREGGVEPPPLAGEDPKSQDTGNPEQPATTKLRKPRNSVSGVFGSVVGGWGQNTDRRRTIEDPLPRFVLQQGYRARTRAGLVGSVALLLLAGCGRFSFLGPN